MQEWQWQTLVLMWFQLKQNTLNPVTDSVFDIVLKDVFAPQDLLLNRIVWVMDTKYLLLWRNGKRHKCLWPREPVAPPETEDPAGEELGKRQGVDLSACVLCPPLSSSAACKPGSFKAYAGNGKCSKCPLHSSSHDQAATICHCDKGFYRAIKDSSSMACTSS